MFIKRKIRKICRSCNAPDISHKMPDLADACRLEHEQKARAYRNRAVCACVAIAFVVTAITAVAKANYNENSLGNSSLNQTEEKESQENETNTNPIYTKVIYGIDDVNSASMYNVYPDTVLISDALLKLFKDENNKDCLYAVEFLLSVPADSPDRNDKRFINASEKYSTFCKYGFYLNRIYRVMTAYPNGSNSSYITSAVKQLRQIMSVEQLEEFAVKHFDEETAEILSSLHLANEKQLRDKSFSEKCLPVLERLTYDKHYDATGFGQNEFIYCAEKDYEESMQWLYGKRIDYYRQKGIEISLIDTAYNNGIFDCLAEVYGATLTKEQIYELMNPKYGVAVFLRQKP